MTHLWTAQMNYARLAISWVQLLGMLVMIVCTARSYRMLKLPTTKRRPHGSLPVGSRCSLCCRF